MLAALLTILKIAGIILLAVLALLILAILLILFVPIRYGAKASYDERPLANATATWLLHLVSFRAVYEDGLNYSLRVLGINIFRKKAKEDMPVKAEEDLEGTNGKVPEKEIREEAREEAETEYEEQVTFEEKTEDEKRLEHPVTELDEEEAAERSLDAEVLREWDKAEEFGDEMREESPLRSIRPAVRRFFRRIGNFFVRLWNFLKERVHYLRVELWEAAIEKRDWLEWFLTDPANVATYHLLWRQLKKLIAHIKPRKLEGDVKFGFDDPYLTGQILVAISPFYPLYGRNITVTPYFDENVAEGRISLKGRVRIFVVLEVIIRMMMDKNFRYLLNRFLNS